LVLVSNASVISLPLDGFLRESIAQIGLPGEYYLFEAVYDNNLFSIYAEILFESITLTCL
jgi:hypothetical protein